MTSSPDSPATDGMAGGRARSEGLCRRHSSRQPALLTDDVLAHAEIAARPFKSHDGHHQYKREHFGDWALDRISPPARSGCQWAIDALHELGWLYSADGDTRHLEFRNGIERVGGD